ncbi:hypothetical protein CJF42_02590 [Pseudoalteromonas sp. NBT06-2]|uniref:radical SAM/SPASM domain-containing protein n=1 Tax=Pseudoalteromonas sp. NBT06-2 TaxID=2025950 RepID=UPI000BA6E582|nr:radical SAM protein [Pseudoalteromonas sp. NBT06-2]PAJ75928.1 hypothetical protein CJF42_02590 [Pseudoalteromonas sp. NBT06-2]
MYSKNLIPILNVGAEVNQFSPHGLDSLDPLPNKDEFVSSAPTLNEPRTSAYTIYVDLPDTDEEMLLVHGYLGHRIKVNKDIAMYLRANEDKRPPRPLYGEWKDLEYRDMKVEKPESEIITSLRKKGFLTLRTQEQEHSFFKQYATNKANTMIKQAPYYLIMPTYSCNLRCPYCFQDHMRTDPNYSHLLKKMTPETVDLVFDNLPVLEARHNFVADEKHVRTFKFFGGEPLLKENRDIIEYTMNRARAEGKAKFLAISNGTDLQHYKDLLGPEGISEIQITFDGTPKEHDKRRIYPDGTGSFELISQNIQLALDLGVKIIGRINVDKNNLTDLPELADVISEKGWGKYSNFGVYLAVIVAHNEQTSDTECFGTRELNHAFIKLKEQYPKLDMFQFDGDAMKKKARRVFETNKENSPQLPQFCGAHNKMYVIDAFADIYACYEKTGDEKIRIGYFDQKSGLNIHKKNECDWRSRTVASNPICSQCRYAFYCGGGCAINAEVRTGKMHANFCDSYGKRFRESVAEAYLESKQA